MCRITSRETRRRSWNWSSRREISSLRFWRRSGPSSHRPSTPTPWRISWACSLRISASIKISGMPSLASRCWTWLTSRWLRLTSTRSSSQSWSNSWLPPKYIASSRILSCRSCSRTRRSSKNSTKAYWLDFTSHSTRSTWRWRCGELWGVIRWLRTCGKRLARRAWGSWRPTQIRIGSSSSLFGYSENHSASEQRYSP